MVLKRFFRWLRNAEFVEGVKIGKVDETVGPEDTLSEEELSILPSFCANLRDKALVETAYESAFRPHEFLGLKKSDVVFDEAGAILYVRKGKRGAMDKNWHHWGQPVSEFTQLVQYSANLGNLLLNHSSVAEPQYKRVSILDAAVLHTKLITIPSRQFGEGYMCILGGDVPDFNNRNSVFDVAVRDQKSEPTQSRQKASTEPFLHHNQLRNLPKAEQDSSWSISEI